MAVWHRTINVHHEFHDPSLAFPARRGAVVARLRSSGWSLSNPSIDELVDELAAAQDADEFDEIWNTIYDAADADRIWIDTIGPIR